MSSTTSRLSSFSKETLVDFAVIPAGVALLGQKIVTSLPSKALALGGALSATAITFGNYIASGESTSRKIIFLVGALGIGALAMPDITSRLSKWTGIVINEREATFITGIAGLLKAVTWALENFTKFPKLKTPENVADLYSLQIRPLHMHFTNNPETFKALDLRMQTALNKRFIDSEYSEIAPTGFSEIGENFTKEELESLASYIDLTLLSKEERQQVVLAFYKNDVPFASTSFQRDDFLTIPLGLDQATAQDLSAEKLKWTHTAICYVMAYPKDPKALDILCQRFFDAHLPSMHPKLHLKTMPTLPSSLDR